MHSEYQLIEITDKNDHLSRRVSPSFGEIIIEIGEYVRDGKFPEDFYIKETITDSVTGGITHRHLTLAVKFT